MKWYVYSDGAPVVLEWASRTTAMLGVVGHLGPTRSTTPLATCTAHLTWRHTPYTEMTSTPRTSRWIMAFSHHSKQYDPKVISY